MVKIDQEFKVTTVLPEQLTKNRKGNTIKKGVELNEDGTLTLIGVASTSNPDLSGDIITEDCIQRMKEKAASLNIHADHIYDINDVIGTITRVLPSEDNELVIKFNIIPSVAPKIKELLDTGVKLGLSIGGKVKEYKPNHNEEGELIGWRITNINLFEVSLTPLPANWDTYGTVQTTGPVTEAKCITGACALMRKSQKQQEKERKMEQISLLKKEIAEIKKDLEETRTMQEELTTEQKENEETDISKEITEETIVNMFNEMAETLKAEILETAKTEIADSVKNEVSDAAATEIETVKNEILETTNNQITSFKDEIISEVQNRIQEVEEKINEEEEEVEEEEIEEVTEGVTVEDETVETKTNEETTPGEETVEPETSVADEMKSFLTEMKTIMEANKVDVEAIKEEVKSSVEEGLLKDVGANREPVATEQPTVKTEPTPAANKTLTVKDKMDMLKANKKSVDDICNKLANEPSSNPFTFLLQESRVD